MRVLSDGDDDAELIAERVPAMSGLAETSAGMQEMFWAIRRFLESLQRERPVVVLFDDIQWAEPTFLDLVEYLAGWSRDARILVVCLARPELLDLRPGWAGLATTAGTLTLSPLNDDESRELIGNLLGASSLAPSDAARIVDAAGGNPLFVEEMLRMLEDEGVLSRDDDRWRVVGDLAQVSLPASIHALLAARLDRLSSGGEGRAGDRGGDRQGVLVGRGLRPGARGACEPGAGASPADPRAQGPHPARALHAGRRGRVPLPPHPDPGGRLPGSVEGASRGRPRALRGLDRGAHPASGSSSTRRSWATTSSRRIGTGSELGPLRRSRRGTLGRARGRAAELGGPAGPRAPGRRHRGDPAGARGVPLRARRPAPGSRSCPTSAKR